MDRQAYFDHLRRGIDTVDDWQDRFGTFEPDDTTVVAPERVAEVLGELTRRLEENYPYGHPRYAGQMLKPPHPVASLAYAIAMQVNPNNHALDGGAATSRMERDVVADLAAMFSFPEQHLGHLTGGGTIANIEALWVARSLHPGRAIAASDQAHYTHGRGCEVLGAAFMPIASDEMGRMDLDALEAALRTGRVGTVVATAGTTGLGMVDPIHEIVPLVRRYDARIHVDAAYGGFFTLLARRPNPPIDPAPFLAIASADSVVVDPHKHGLQPYGCGSVIFRDPAVGRFYVHDSPYTYFTSDELHLGEISLECSRAGASAAALWATLRCMPLEPEAGLGAILGRSREAALRWSSLIAADPRFRLVVAPDLDIVTLYPAPGVGGPATASGISRLVDRLFDSAEHDPDGPAFFAKFVVPRRLLVGRDAEIVWDQPTVTVLRSVLMKPEHLAAIPMLHEALIRQLANVAEAV
ncbi:MAG TPA: aminotransferase class I/II-fold pyridoxal phosphate-dependent enzyme [Thermomicrobiales bacterium]|nr:aminotransferase class I/II-fold pyridoxal phosphate-dependent enzyme [Thermomicrobiales bacterium]